jgi:cytochrome o ubiquinol oxidase subunit IV
MSNTHKLAQPQPEKAKKLFRSYIIGLIFAVLLTIVSYIFVENKIFTGETLFFVLSILLILQMIVQVCFYLRLSDEKSDEGWSSLSLIFTLMIIAIIVAGNLWILYNLNYNMMM